MHHQPILSLLGQIFWFKLCCLVNIKLVVVDVNSEAVNERC